MWGRRLGGGLGVVGGQGKRDKHVLLWYNVPHEFVVDKLQLSAAVDMKYFGDSTDINVKLAFACNTSN